MHFHQRYEILLAFVLDTIAKVDPDFFTLVTNIGITPFEICNYLRNRQKMLQN